MSQYIILHSIPMNLLIKFENSSPLEDRFLFKVFPFPEAYSSLSSYPLRYILPNSSSYTFDLFSFDISSFSVLSTNLKWFLNRKISSSSPANSSFFDTRDFSAEIRFLKSKMSFSDSCLPFDHSPVCRYFFHSVIFLCESLKY